MDMNRINKRGKKHLEKEVTIITFSVFLMIVGLKTEMQLAAIISFILNKPVNREKTSEENN